MLRSRVGLLGIIIASVLLTACSSFNSAVNSFPSIFQQPPAQEPTRVPVIYAPGPSYYSHDVVVTRGYYGYGHYYDGYGYRHCYMVGGKHHRHRVCYRNYGYMRGYYGCTGYIPAYAAEDRVCSKWEWMPTPEYSMYK